MHRTTRRLGARALLAKRGAQLTLLVLLLMLAAMLAIGLYTAHSLYRSAEDRYIGVVLPLKAATGDVVTQMLNEETGVRAYMITRDRRSLKPYLSGRKAVIADVARLSQLDIGRPELAQRLSALRREIRALHGFYDRLITFVADSPLGAKRARMEVLDGERLFARFRRTSALMQSDIGRLVESTRASQKNTYDGAVGALAVAGFLALVIAATLLFEAPERLRRLYAAEEEARLDAEQGANAARALAHVSDAVLLIDDSGQIRSWNEAAELLLGVPRTGAIARPAEEVVPEYSRLVEAGRRGDVFVPVSVADDEVWLSPALSSFEGGSVLTIRDVTARYLLERARADFVTTASHELRTPLTAIYGGVRTLLGRGAELAEEQRLRLLRMIEQESEQLARIVDQLLVTAQLDRGSLRTSETPCDLRAICEGVLVAAEARNNVGATLVLNEQDELGSILCDESLLRQVLANLVDNALKYSPEGGRIQMELTADDDAVQIAVDDEGLGIPASEQGRIFEKFYRLDAEMTRGVGGSGLGLYISREIIERMDGTLSVLSTPGGGSTFTVTLPRRTP